MTKEEIIQSITKAGAVLCGMDVEKMAGHIFGVVEQFPDHNDHIRILDYIHSVITGVKSIKFVCVDCDAYRMGYTYGKVPSRCKECGGQLKRQEGDADA